MLIDFKIRALFIWTDPYLPDLVLTKTKADIANKGVQSYLFSLQLPNDLQSL